MQVRQSWHVRFRLTSGNLQVLKAGDGQLLPRINAELAASSDGRSI